MDFVESWDPRGGELEEGVRRPVSDEHAADSAEERE